MNKYNPNIHQRKSIRLKGYDYSQAGLYFITICCQDRIYRFGDVVNGKMVCNEYGEIAHNEWMNTVNIRKNVELGEFIIMPNHIHGIIQLLGRGESHSPDNGDVCKTPDNVAKSHSPDNGDVCKTPDNVAESHSPDNGDVCKTPLRSPSQTIGAIVRGYKSSVTKQLGLLRFDGKLWQRNYYEHIIRNEKSHQTITEYIINNPAKWAEDKFYTI